jgi:hypothetical protein
LAENEFHGGGAGSRFLKLMEECGGPAHTGTLV